LVDRQSLPGHKEHNAVSAVMAELGVGVQEAMDWVGHFHDMLVDSFLAEYQRVPLFPDERETVNREILEYADALGNWVRACDQWSFEVRRFFFVPHSGVPCDAYFCRVNGILVMMDVACSERGLSLCGRRLSMYLPRLRIIADTGG
jgi:hypothetical protein